MKKTPCLREKPEQMAISVSRLQKKLCFHLLIHTLLAMYKNLASIMMQHQHGEG